MPCHATVLCLESLASVFPGAGSVLSSALVLRWPPDPWALPHGALVSEFSLRAGTFMTFPPCRQKQRRTSRDRKKLGSGQRDLFVSKELFSNMARFKGTLARSVLFGVLWFCDLQQVSP